MCTSSVLVYYTAGIVVSSNSTRIIFAIIIKFLPLFKETSACIQSDTVYIHMDGYDTSFQSLAFTALNIIIFINNTPVSTVPVLHHSTVEGCFKILIIYAGMH